MDGFEKRVWVYIVFLVILLGTAYAQQPVLPHVIEGRVSFQGDAAPAGVIVEAKVDGAVVATTKTGDDSRYAIAIPGSQSTEGKPIQLDIGGVSEAITSTWATGKKETIHADLPQPHPDKPAPTPTTTQPESPKPTTSPLPGRDDVTETTTLQLIIGGGLLIVAAAAVIIVFTRKPTKQ